MFKKSNQGSNEMIKKEPAGIQEKALRLFRSNLNTITGTLQLLELPREHDNKEGWGCLIKAVDRLAQKSTDVFEDVEAQLWISGKNPEQELHKILLSVMKKPKSCKKSSCKRLSKYLNPMENEEEIFEQTFEAEDGVWEALYWLETIGAQKRCVRIELKRKVSTVEQSNGSVQKQEVRDALMKQESPWIMIAWRNTVDKIVIAANPIQIDETQRRFTTLNSEYLALPNEHLLASLGESVKTRGEACLESEDLNKTSERVEASAWIFKNRPIIKESDWLDLKTAHDVPSQELESNAWWSLIALGATSMDPEQSVALLDWQFGCEFKRLFPNLPNLMWDTREWLISEEGEVRGGYNKSRENPRWGKALIAYRERSTMQKDVNSENPPSLESHVAVTRKRL